MGGKGKRKLPCFFGFLLIIEGIGCDASLPDPESPAARLYQQRCSGCHRLYSPHLLTSEMWSFMVDRMEQEMLRRGVTPLKAEERKTILQYLQKYSHKPS